MSAASRILRAVIDTNLIVSAFILRRGNSDSDLLVLAGNPAIAGLQIVDVAAFLKVIDTP
jgi:hypothetical protein